jgi:hypothetical protein
MGMEWDLATVAGISGLGASAIAALGTAFFFRGLITRVVAQVIASTVLSFVGFVGVFYALGFQIIPPKEVAGITIPSMPGAESFSVQTAPNEPAEPAGPVIKSPWRK